METKAIKQQAFEARLEKLNAQITEMKAKADQASAEGKAQYYEQLQSLTEQHQTAQQKLDEFKASSEAAWESVSAGMETAIKDLQVAFDQAVAQFQ